MAVAALLLWLGTAAIGGYLLVTAIHSGNNQREPEESVTVPAEQPAAARTGPAGAAARSRPGRAPLPRRDRGGATATASPRCPCSKPGASRCPA